MRLISLGVVLQRTRDEYAAMRANGEDGEGLSRQVVSLAEVLVDEINDRLEQLDWED